MKINHVISSILKGNWLVDPSYANAQLPLIYNLLNGKPAAFAADDELDKNQLPFVVLDNNQILTLNSDATASLFASSNGSANIPSGVVAVIPVKGAILKEDNCGDAGSMTRARQLTNLSNNDNISSIVLLFDSPGGMVDGTQTFADAINNAKKKKPVLGFVEDGMAASAAYWFASQTTELYVSHDTSSVGSVGVFVRLLDVKPAYAKEGFVIHEIYADGSEEKNLPYKEALDSKYELIKTNMLNPIREAFVAAVKNGRGNKLKAKGKWDKGAMFQASDAQEQGLIDGIMSFEQVLARAAELANTKPSKSNSNQSNNNMKLKTASHAALIAMLNITVAEGQTETAELTESQMNDLNAAVVALQGQVSTAEQSINALNTEKETLTASLTKATNDLSAANTSLTTAQAEVTRLKAFEPVSTVVTQGKTDATQAIHNDADMNAIAELPHNKALNGNPMFN